MVQNPLPQLLAAELGLTTTLGDELTEDALTAWLAERIAELLQHRTEYLFNVLYCMDVSEAAMHEALRPDAPVPPDIGLAKLMIARQKERNRTKSTYIQPKIDDDLAW